MKRRRTPPIERLLRNCVEVEAGCWEWQGHLSSNYVVISLGAREDGRAMGHRLSYEFFRADIPAGLDIDHLCRNKRCVNPWHLEPVTHQVNVQRADLSKNGGHNRSKTHCVNGHELVGRNLYVDKRGHRHCAECNRVRSLRSYHQKKAS